MPQFLKINQCCFAFPALSLFGFRWMSAIDSDHYSISGRHRSESLADLLQIRWPTWIGITGRLVPYYAEKALRASDAVVHILVNKSDIGYASGTGFMISDDLLVTNHHVISSRREALAAEFTFRYQLDINGIEITPVPVKSHSEGIFYTNPELDFTIVQLYGNPGEKFGSLKLKEGPISLDQRVNIIQHPGGHPKKISIQNNFVAYVDNTIIQYYTSTMPGSSGSPVMNDEFQVIAIHHSGGMVEEPRTKRRFLRNEGTPITAILSDLRNNESLIFSKINPLL